MEIVLLTRGFKERGELVKNYSHFKKKPWGEKGEKEGGFKRGDKCVLWGI